MTPPKAPAAPQSGPRDQILESTIHLMRQSGLSGAGINQILAHSGAPKGSMYYYFPGGKQQITSEALTLYGRRIADAFETALSSKNEPAGMIRALFRLIADRLEQGTFDQSCAAGAVVLDLGPEVGDIRNVVADVLASWRTVIARHLPMRSRDKRESFAGLVISAIEGGYILGRAERSTAPLLEAGAWLALLVKND